MLRYLLDEQISPVVANRLIVKNPQIVALSVHRWRSAALLGALDASLLRAASEERLTLVTYDVKTIPDLIADWATQGIPHAGVVFVSSRSIASNDLRALVGALQQLWRETRALDWRNRTIFLRRP